jgi:ABC-type glycerol-3-phosphate transport system substrate-binding protein
MRFRSSYAAAALALLLAGCGGAEEGADAAPGSAAASAAAPSDTGLDATVTVDTQALPGDTAEHAH